ncbi:hypothetical protein H4R34_004474 [Dimargaris verticillata]|uniref:G-patch domain-containing protein n=1 Tax=Dimargaris verticillata TaxID=2761393 RepID=A0A9W8B4U4_9FUNG|nr:hypothetical protein H4R34_004474 [Dimargaris verticillata]
MADTDVFDQLMQDYVGLRDASANPSSSTQHSLNQTKESTICSTHAPPAVAGFEPTQPDRQYWFHADLNLWYDAATRVYSVYDSATTTYVPVNITDYYTAPSSPTADSAGVAKGAMTLHDWAQQSATHAIDCPMTPTSSATAPTGNTAPGAAELPPLLRLVVLESATLLPGQVVMVSADGVTVGRDRAPAGLRLRIPDMATSRYHAYIFCHAQPDQVSFVDPFAPSPVVHDAAGVQGFTSHRGSEPPPTASSHGLSNASDREEGELDDEVCGQGPDSHGHPATADHSNHEKLALSANVPPSHQFWVVDCGSQHGTFVNDHRLSNPKEASRPTAVQHGDTLTFGTTVFGVHQHLDSEWGCCQQCLLHANNQIPTAESATGPSSHTQLLIPSSSSQSAAQSPPQSSLLAPAPAASMIAPGVILSAPPQRHPQSPSPVVTNDRWHRTPTASPRAAQRTVRRQPPRDYNQASHSSSPIHLTSKNATTRTLKEQSATAPFPKPAHFPPLPKSVAQTVMEKMGWSRGQGLGKHQSGVTEPIAVAMRPVRSGLGFCTAPHQLPMLPTTESTTLVDSVQATKRARIQRLTQHRYYQTTNE